MVETLLKKSILKLRIWSIKYCYWFCCIFRSFHGNSLEALLSEEPIYMWPKITLHSVWPRWAKRLDTHELGEVALESKNLHSSSAVQYWKFLFLSRLLHGQQNKLWASGSTQLNSLCPGEDKNNERLQQEASKMLILILISCWKI